MSAAGKRRAAARLLGELVRLGRLALSELRYAWRASDVCPRCVGYVRPWRGFLLCGRCGKSYSKHEVHP